MLGLRFLSPEIRPRGAGFQSPVPIVPNAPGNATRGVAYSYTPFTYGGTPPYTYALTGTLPTGLTFHTGTGVIDGTPTGSTATGLTITATDSIAGTGSVGPFTLTVLVAPAFTNSPATTGAVGSAYTYTPTVTGGTAPLVYSVTGTLPAGLSLNTSTGVISGTPTTAATYSGITETVTDANGLTGSVGPVSIVVSAGGSPVLFTHDFLTTPSMPAGLSLSRATVGTYWDSSGVLQSAAINAARFGNAWDGSAWVAEGLLVEEQRTNYVEESDMTTASFNWREPGAGFASVTAVAGLDGTSSAWKFVPSTSNGAHMVYHISVGPSSSTPATHSVYAKPNGYTKLAIRDSGSTGGGSTSTQLLSGAGSIFADNQENSVVITSKIGARGSGGWYRCMATFTPPGSTQNTVGFLPLDASFPGGSTDPWTSYNYVGDGTSGITLNFPQMELGAFPTSVIFPPPTGGPVTRSADLVSASGTLATQLAAGPSVWEMQDQATGVISRTSFAAGAFTFPTSKLYRSFGVYPSGTNTAPYLTVGGPY